MKWGFSAGDVVTKEKYCKGLIAYGQKHDISKEALISLIRNFSQLPLKTAKYTMNSDSLVLKTIWAGSSRLCDCWDGFEYRADGERWELDRWEFYIKISDSNISLDGCVLSDDGKNLELAVLDVSDSDSADVDSVETVGYISAVYTISGGTCTLTITDVSESIASDADSIKNLTRTLSYESDTDEYPLKK